MSRSRAVLDAIASRQAALQSRERLQAKTSSISTFTGKSQPVLSIRSQKAALQTSSVPKVQSRPFHRQVVPTAAPPKQYLSAAQLSVKERVQAELDRRAPAARPSFDKAKVVETCVTVRRPHGTRQDSVSVQKQARRPALVSRRARQPSPETVETLLIESLFPNSPAPSESSSTTGRSFSFIALPHEKPAIPSPAALVVSVPSTPRRPLPPRPVVPQAPRAVKSHDIGIRAAPIPVLLRSIKALPKGILKKAGEARSTARRAVRFREDFRQCKGKDGKVLGEVEWMKRTPRWIGLSQAPDDPRTAFQQHASVLEAQAKARDVHPDPTRLFGKLRSWTGPDGNDEYLFGTDIYAPHAECPSPDCNKKTLHQFQRKVLTYKELNFGWEDLPTGEPIQHFNKRHGYSWSYSPEEGPRYPKDQGL